MPPGRTRWARRFWPRGDPPGPAPGQGRFPGPGNLTPVVQCLDRTPFGTAALMAAATFPERISEGEFKP